MSITQAPEKIKGFLVSPVGKDILLALVIIGFSLSSFMLGEASGAEKAAKIKPLVVDSKGKALMSADLVSSSSESTTALLGENTASASSATVSGSSVTSGKLSPDTIVASSKGTKYYFGRCAGAKALSPANIVVFESEADAQKAGYTKSTSCK